LAGLGRKEFNSGDILLASEVQGYLQDQAVMVFDDATARGSAIPSPSEGMLTYNKDTDQLELYDGSAFGPVGSDAGLVHIKQESGTGVTAISVNDCFSSEYSTYKILITSTGTAQASMRLRVSGADNSNSEYRVNLSIVRDDGTSAGQSTLDTSFTNTAGPGQGRSGITSNIDCFYPFDTVETKLLTQSTGASVAKFSLFLTAATTTVTTSYTGFSILFNASTNATVDVYGYKLGS
jgi:hypothetical protein